MVEIIYDGLTICPQCAVVIVNGDDSADPERAERAYQQAYAIYGDQLRDLVIGECETDGWFVCDYCREDGHSYGEHYMAVIFG